MYLVAVIVILSVWLINGVIEKFRPPAPPIDDIEAHTKMILQANPNQRKNLLKSSVFHHH